MVAITVVVVAAAAAAMTAAAGSALTAATATTAIVAVAAPVALYINTPKAKSFLATHNSVTILGNWLFPLRSTANFVI